MVLLAIFALYITIRVSYLFAKVMDNNTNKMCYRAYMYHLLILWRLRHKIIFHVNPTI